MNDERIEELKPIDWREAMLMQAILHREEEDPAAVLAVYDENKAVEIDIPSEMGDQVEEARALAARDALPLLDTIGQLGKRFREHEASVFLRWADVAHSAGSDEAISALERALGEIESSIEELPRTGSTQDLGEEQLYSVFLLLAYAHSLLSAMRSFDLALESVDVSRMRLLAC